jgi:hypothetical protein
MVSAHPSDNAALPAIATTQEDVQELFLQAPGARSCYDDWMRNPRRARVRPLVLNHETRVLYDLSFRDVFATCKRTSHALGDIKWSDIQHVKPAQNWHPTFAFTHLLHHLMEQIGGIPTWDVYWDFLRKSSVGRGWLGDEASEQEEALVREGEPQEIAEQAIQWRIGNAYYGILRDLYTVSYLREEGLDVRAHPLADALFRADGWVGRTVLSLRIGNKVYRKDYEGRKVKVEDLLARAPQPFRIETIELETPTVYGSVKLPSRADMDRVIRDIRNSDGIAH